MDPAWAGENIIHDIRQIERGRNSVGQGLTPFKLGDHVQVLDDPFNGVSTEVFSRVQYRAILFSARTR